MGLGDVAHGFGEEIHHQHGGIGEVEVSKVAMNNGNLRQAKTAKRKEGSWLLEFENVHTWERTKGGCNN